MVLSQFLQLDLLQTDTTKNPTVLFQIHLLVLSTFSNLCFDKLMAQHSVASRMCTPSMRILHEGNCNLVFWTHGRSDAPVARLVPVIDGQLVLGGDTFISVVSLYNGPDGAYNFPFRPRTVSSFRTLDSNTTFKARNESLAKIIRVTQVLRCSSPGRRWQ